MNVKWLRRLKVTDAPVHSREETSKYTDLLPNGKAREFTFYMEAKSIITSPSGGQKIPGAGFVEIRGIAWSGHGKVVRVDVSVDGGSTWTQASLQEPVLTRALTRFRYPVAVERTAGGDREPSRRRDRIRAASVRATRRRARRQLVLSQQRDPAVARRGQRRGDQWQRLIERPTACGVLRTVAAALLLTLSAPSIAQTALWHRPRSDAGRSGRVEHRRRARWPQLSAGSGHCRARPRRVRRAVRRLSRRERRRWHGRQAHRRRGHARHRQASQDRRQLLAVRNDAVRLHPPRERAPQLPPAFPAAALAEPQPSLRSRPPQPPPPRATPRASARRPSQRRRSADSSPSPSSTTMPPPWRGLSITSVTVHVVVSVSPARTGARKRARCSRYAIAVPWKYMPTAAPMIDEVSMPCRIGVPKRVRLRELRVHVMRIEIADESGTHDDVRFGDGDGTVEAIADANVFEPCTAALQRVHPATAAPRSRRLASSARQSSVNAMPA